jgi:4-diphosphocytidyl-2C-methyl-D-erythritol kinase
MHLPAPAKINLHLRVGPPRADGFHPLLSWMCTVGLFDELDIEPAGQTSLTCDDPSIPTGADNLIVKAAAALGATAKIHLVKRIPAGGGLAGGSSDAARTLLGLDRLLNLGCTQEKLMDIARRLGSDIPFFLFGPSSICKGLGEIIRPTPVPAARWALLILPSFPMPTPRVYRRFDEMNLGKQSSIEIEPDFAAWARLPAREMLVYLVNDLEAPAFDLNPALGRLRAAWEQRLGQIVRMSGSGSTLFTLYDQRPPAQTDVSARTLAVELAPEALITPGS